MYEGIYISYIFFYKSCAYCIVMDWHFRLHDYSLNHTSRPGPKSVDGNLATFPLMVPFFIRARDNWLLAQKLA